MRLTTQKLTNPIQEKTCYTCKNFIETSPDDYDDEWWNCSIQLNINFPNFEEIWENEGKNCPKWETRYEQ